MIRYVIKGLDGITRGHVVISTHEIFDVTAIDKTMEKEMSEALLDAFVVYFSVGYA